MAPNTNPWPIDDHTVPSATVIPSSENTAGLYRRSFEVDRDPMVRGCEAPLALHAACFLRATVAISRAGTYRSPTAEELNVYREK
jgi:hypothetical protein